MLSLGVSRGFAFVEFYHFQDATSWMEANQVASLTKSRYIPENGTSLYSLKKKKKEEKIKVEGVVCSIRVI